MSSRFFRVYAPALFVLSACAAELQVPGIPNFHVVNEHIYRGAQPSDQGFHNLAKLGVKTVVDLRNGAERDAGEAGVVGKEGMRYFHVPMAGVGAPTEDQVYSVLRVLDDGAGWPVFIHCRRGADRTGTVAACYRIAHDQWPNEKALNEARLDGMSWMERAMQRYILTFRPDPKQMTLGTLARPGAESANKEVQ
jgi:tyrosine-protein phosphatase SIW14